MKQLTEEELRELIRNAFDEGVTYGQDKDLTNEPDVIDMVRDIYAEKIVDSV